MKTKNGKPRIFVAVIIMAVLAAIATLFWPEDPYAITTQINKSTIRDTLLVDIVTYMGPKPKSTDWQTRHQPQHRKFYINQSKDYTIHRYYIAEDGNHYFYMIRPARHADGNRRAIGGRLRVDENFNITDYEEIFVTHVLDEDYLKTLAQDLFPALINNELEDYMNNPMIIEWPDGRLKYHKIKKEWRYDVDDQPVL